jgi:hypothetical protein
MAPEGLELAVRRVLPALDLAAHRQVSLAPDLAADSVSDLLDTFSILPRIDDFSALAELRGSGQTLRFHATDPGLGAAGEWLARRTPSGVEWEHRHGRGDATLRGRALDLLLVLSRRAPWTAPGSTPWAIRTCRVPDRRDRGARRVLRERL